MSPPLESWSAAELPERVQIDEKNKRRKTLGKEIDLTKCVLEEMVQYDCRVEQPVTKESKVVCEPIVRLFRKCKDQKGQFRVETTAWEGELATNKS